MPLLLAITKDDNKSKLAIYKLYNFSKGETDIIDQRMGFYSCKLKSKRWIMNAFSYVLDTCRVNASTIYAMNNDLQPRNIKSIDFGFELAMSLIRPHIEQRNLIGINSSVVHKIEIVLEKKYPPNMQKTNGFYPHQSEKRRRCDACISKIKGEEAKEKKNKISKQLSKCQKCAKPLCNKHLIRICGFCLQD